MNDFFALIILGIILILAFIGGCSSGMNYMCINAVESGHAYWKPDSYGSTTFHWKEITK